MFFKCLLGAGATHCSSPLLSNQCTGASGLLRLLLLLFQCVLIVLAVCLQQLVPPGEGGGVVPDKVHVVEVVESGASVERDEMERVHWDVITTDMG